ncbi:MAG: hypothetical protein K9J27_06925 [Bacteroidales bacterium]|nr:hypothetical protein [Bacteroidales bacterium]MCF8333703.1 hypothetical protein [Bacteroidales bacterium]
MKARKKRKQLKVALMLTLMASVFVSCEDEIVATSILTTEVDPGQITGNTAVVAAEILRKSDNIHGEYGFCWNTTGNPTIYDDNFIIGEDPEVGEFSAELASLNPQTTYAVRAFVQVGETYAYAPMMIFQTREGYQNNYFLNEPFSSNGNGWIEVAEEYTTFEVTGGQYHMLYSEPGYFLRSWNTFSGFAQLISEDEVGIQFDLESSSTNSGSNTSEVGFIWNVTDVTFSFIIISVEPGDNSVVYIGNYDNGFNVTGSFQANSYLNVQNGYYSANIRLIVSQNQNFDLLINDSPAYSFSEAVNNDNIGFYISEADMYIDDLLIYSNTRKNLEVMERDSNIQPGIMKSKK